MNVNVIPQIKNNPAQSTNSATNFAMKSFAKSSKKPAFTGKHFEINDTSKAFSFLKWLGDDFNPAMQRLLTGVTALFTQPFFDWNNKRVDEDTRKTSTARTLGKIIAGTLTGVAIREFCIRATKKFTQNENIARYEIEKYNEKALKKGKELKAVPNEFSFKTVEHSLLPKNMWEKATASQIKKYRNFVGTSAAILIMVATNFLIDAPLTTYLANFFNKRFHKEAQKPAEGGK